MLRIEVSYFVVDKDTNNRTSEGIRFYRNKNKTPLSAPLDRHRRAQYDKALELIENKDYARHRHVLLGSRGRRGSR